MIALAAGIGLSGCYDRAESVKPGSSPAGEGAGSRGGDNSGDTRIDGNPPGSANAEGLPGSSPTPKQ